MNRTNQFPEVPQSGLMPIYYRERFEALANGILKPKDKAVLIWYLRERAGGRLAALNAVRELRPQHLDSLFN